MRSYNKKSQNKSHAMQPHPQHEGKQASIETILQRYATHTLPGKEVGVIQQKSLADEEEPIQQKTENRTGLPDDLKAGVENLSGYSMDDVRVHYNSDKPAQLQALAYTQGTDIHVAPGQEKHLPHEAWHVVQQKQGRVQPTMQMRGIQLNDNEELEKEADKNAESLIQRKSNHPINEKVVHSNAIQTKKIVQRFKDNKGYIYWYGRNFRNNHLTDLTGNELRAETIRRSNWNKHIETLINRKSLENSFASGDFTIRYITDKRAAFEVNVIAGTCSWRHYESVDCVVVHAYCENAKDAMYNYYITHLSSSQ